MRPSTSLLAALVPVILTGSGPGPQPAAAPVATFPTVGGRALTGRAMTLPRDFEGDVNVVIVAFTRGQQADVDSWLPALRALAERHPALRYYELPTLGSSMKLMRGVIDGGMRRGIPDTLTRARTVTLYTDKSAFRKALGIATEKAIVVMVVRRTGEVRWRREGAWSEEKAGELEGVLGGEVAR